MARNGEVVVDHRSPDYTAILSFLRRARRRARIWANNSKIYNQPLGASEMHAAYRRRAKKRGRK